jgi:hypothetical protein
MSTGSTEASADAIYKEPLNSKISRENGMQIEHEFQKTLLA